jgi:hypothetical protein
MPATASTSDKSYSSHTFEFTHRSFTGAYLASLGLPDLRQRTPQRRIRGHRPEQRCLVTQRGQIGKAHGPHQR